MAAPQNLTGWSSEHLEHMAVTVTHDQAKTAFVRLTLNHQINTVKYFNPLSSLNYVVLFANA